MSTGNGEAEQVSIGNGGAEQVSIGNDILPNTEITTEHSLSHKTHSELPLRLNS